MSPVFASTSRRLGGVVVTLLLIEFLDELVFGVGESAWPLIRADLRLDYAQIGLLLSLPGLLAAFVEPAFGILADRGYTRWLILIVVASFLALALWGYNPDDPGWSHAVYTTSLHNPAGRSGAWLSELLPHTAGIVDDLCIVRSMYTEAINHDPAVTFLQTGHQQPGRGHGDTRQHRRNQVDASHGPGEDMVRQGPTG